MNFLSDFQSNVESGIAIVRGIIGNGCLYGAALDGKLKRFLGEIGEAGDPRFAVAVGADFQLCFPLVKESVLYEDVNFGVINRLS